MPFLEGAIKRFIEKHRNLGYARLGDNLCIAYICSKGKRV
jgi:hypothetical protein